MYRLFILLLTFVSLVGVSYTSQARHTMPAKPALSINYTEKHVPSLSAVKTLVSYVNRVNPHAYYDVVGYEVTPKNTKQPVSKRVMELKAQLLKHGVNADKIYLLVKPSPKTYQKVDIFVRN